jgi:hypothetical protein
MLSAEQHRHVAERLRAAVDSVLALRGLLQGRYGRSHRASIACDRAVQSIRSTQIELASAAAVEHGSGVAAAYTAAKVHHAGNVADAVAGVGEGIGLD